MLYFGSGATNATGFAAIKLTALGRPQFLVNFNKITQIYLFVLEVIILTVVNSVFSSSNLLAIFI